MKSTYRDIFFSTSLVGAQQGVRLAVGVVQSKVVAVLLGATGTGAFGLYSTLLNLGQSLFGLGINSSGVRQIAVARRPDSPAPAQEIRILLGAHAVLALLAGAVFWLMRRPISRWTFGDEASVPALGYLAVSLAATLMAVGALAVLQGLRKIRTLTVIHILAAIASAGTSIALIFRYRSAGIAPAFLGSSLCVLTIAWVFLPKLPRSEPLTSGKVVREVSALTRLGTGFLAASLLTALSAYVVRALLTRHLGLQAAGLYQAGWMLATFYVSTVLQAMGTDFLPRICAVTACPEELNRQVNEQVEAGVLIVVPGLLLCLVAAPWLLRLLYTSEFLSSVGAARWMIAGMLIRAAAWPLSYMPMALNRPRVILLSETLAAAALIGFSAIGIRTHGLEGAGMAFLAASLLYTTVLLILARRLTSFSFSVRCRQLFLVLYPVAAVAFLLLAFPGKGVLPWGALVWVALVCLGCAIHAVRLLGEKIPSIGSPQP
ncbi:MAG: oligosaccharide flippase family protein [Kiritimatiellia bacterium]|nr:oligosaccharide flippase family protein [Kiritimatiellia bacterium]